MDSVMNGADGAMPISQNFWARTVPDDRQSIERKQTEN